MRGYLKLRAAHGLKVKPDQLGWHLLAKCGDEVEAVFVDHTHGSFVRMMADDVAHWKWVNAPPLDIPPQPR